MRTSISCKSFMMSLLASCLIAAPPLLAQTGKISGRIVDAQSRNPLPGVNVIIEGTSLGAASDDAGDYFIINIPPGVFTLQASMVGYAVQTRTQVQVQTDRTVVVDFQMGTQAVQGEEVTISAEREIIKMDMSGSSTYIAGEELTSAPVTQVADYLMIQEGVTYERNTSGNWLSVRGGGRDETDFILDGQSTMNHASQTAYLGVSRTAIKEVSIQTGGFNAEYGRARSGLVNVVTRDGSRAEYSAAFEGKYSFPHLKHFGRNLYDPNQAMYWTRIGRTNFIPEDKVNATGSYEQDATGNFIDGQSWTLNGEVLIDPASPEYRGYKVDAATGAYLDGANVPYTEADIQKYGMNKWSYPALLGWNGWDKTSQTLRSNAIVGQDDFYPQDLLGEWIIQHENHDYGNKPDYDMDVTVTGPLPGERMHNKLGDILATSTFMASYRSQTSRFAYASAAKQYRDENLQVKLTSSLTSQTKLRIGALYGAANSIGTGQSVLAGTSGSALEDLGSSLYPNEGQRGLTQTLSGATGGSVFPGNNPLGRPYARWWSEGNEYLTRDYLFQSYARLTHTVNPSTYIEAEVQYALNSNRLYPSWNHLQPGCAAPGCAYPHYTWLYNKKDAAGNLLLNEQGTPRVFVTNEPDKIFEDGQSLILDPITRDLWDKAANNLSVLRANSPENINERNIPFSFGGDRTWPFDMEQLQYWQDEKTRTLVGGSRLDMARGFDTAGNPVAWVDDFAPLLAQMNGRPWEFFHQAVNVNGQEPYFWQPARGGLMYGPTLDDYTLLGGYRAMGGWEQGQSRDRLNEYNQSGQSARMVMGTEIRTVGGRLTAVSQITKHNQLKAGVDFQFYQAKNQYSARNGSQIRAADANWAGAFYTGDRIDGIGGGNYVQYWNKFNENPFELSAYLQDKIEVQGLVANIGIRMDMFDPTTFMIDLTNPYRTEYSYPYRYTTNTPAPLSHFSDEYAPGVPKYRVNPVIKWSPRLGLSFPVTETSKVYFNYGWFYQRPGLFTMYQWHSTGVDSQRFIVPAPDLDWPRTIQMEMGYEQSIKGWFLLHAAGFYKDSDALIRNIFYTGLAQNTYLTGKVNDSYSDVRGLEFRADKNYGLFRISGNYTYQISSRGRAGTDQVYEDVNRQLEEQEATIRALSETRPLPQPFVRATGGFYSPRNWGPKLGENLHPLDNIIISMIYTWRDGGERRQYTGLTADLDYYVDIVDRSNTNLRAEKRFAIGRNMNLGAFFQVFNLWNQKFLMGPNGNGAMHSQNSNDYNTAFRYDHESATTRGNDTWGDYKTPHLAETLPWWKDNIMFDLKRDVFYGLYFSFN